jgi:hypothetical protein
MKNETTKTLVHEMVEESQELQQAAGGAVTNALAGWVAAKYASAARDKLAATELTDRWELLRCFAQDLALLRRGDLAAARLQLDRERLEWERAQAQPNQMVRIE